MKIKPMDMKIAPPQAPMTIFFIYAVEPIHNCYLKLLEVKYFFVRKKTSNLLFLLPVENPLYAPSCLDIQSNQ